MVSIAKLMVIVGGGTVMIFPRNSGDRLATMDASGTAISLAFGGTGAGMNGGGTDAWTIGAGGSSGESILRKRPRNSPANFDLTMVDMTFVF